MTTLDTIMQLKNQGKSEGEIIATLRSQGISPLEISEGLNQSKIKEAVYDSNPTQGMTPSMMPSEKKSEYEEPEDHSEDPYYPEPENLTAQPPQNYSGNYNPPMYQNYSSPPIQEPQYFPEENYSTNQEYDYSQGEYPEANYEDNTDTIIEIAEQVFSEKTKKITKEIHSLNEFKSLFEIKVDNLSQRLERMEKQFDKMQISILEKVGEYGKGLNYLKKELNMVEDSLYKLNSKK